MRTRFEGQLEGISPKIKEQVLREAAEQGVSVFDWLETAVKRQLKSSQ
jgi:predicted HicB family RNase H-like nuclease